MPTALTVQPNMQAAAGNRAAGNEGNQLERQAFTR